MPPRRDTDPGSASAAIAATDGASSPTACRSTSKPSKPSGPATSRCESPWRTTAPNFCEQFDDGVGGLHAGPRPARHPHRTAGDDRRGQERHRVGQVGLDGPVPRRNRARLRRASGCPGCRRRSTPASRSIATVIAMCGADGTDSPVWTTVRPSVNVAPDSSSPETNCDEADASISTVPPATDPVPCTRNGRPSPSSATPRPRIASSRGAIGRARACSSPSNVTTSAPSAATGGTKRSTVPARPQSMRRAGCGPIAPPTDRSVPGAVE